MRLTSLRVHNFRNHISSTFEFGDRTNVLLGDNGQGKTNIIEAISYLCLTKSFYASNDAVVLNREGGAFEVEGAMSSEHGIDYLVRVAYDKSIPQKAYFINRRSVEPFSSVIGKYPVVICSPEHAPITMGSPSERRKFVDLVVSQSSEVYFKTLLEYRHTLKQRNKILLDGKFSNTDISMMLESWNEQLIKLGTSLIRRRQKFVEEFQSFMQSAYHKVVDVQEEPTLEYDSAVHIEPTYSEADITETFRQALDRKNAEERQSGTTLVGPHRDEFACTINGLDLRKYASQGQHKTFLVALKLAEFFYLQKCCNETPILLLDDIFSELDEHRTDHLLNFVETVSQTFITSTSSRVFDDSIEFDNHNRKFFIDNGAVVPQQKLVGAMS